MRQAAHAVVQTSAAVRPGPFQIMKFEVTFKLDGQSDGSQRPSALQSHPNVNKINNHGLCFQVLCGTSLYPVTQTPILE